MRSVDEGNRTKWTVPVVVLEVLIVVVSVALLAGSFGTSGALAAVAGLLLMVSIGIPSCALVVWGREKSNVAFMSSVVGTILGKFLVVGIAVAWVLFRARFPPLEFVGGLLLGWIASFGALGLALRRATRVVGSVDGRPA